MFAPPGVLDHRDVLLSKRIHWIIHYNDQQDDAYYQKCVNEIDYRQDSVVIFIIDKPAFHLSTLNRIDSIFRFRAALQTASVGECSAQ
jgi:hypothetical protein